MHQTTALLSALTLYLTGATAIIGGQPVPDTSYAYTVALIQPNAGPRMPTNFICDAVLVGPSTLITATECTTGFQPSDLSARIGMDAATRANVSVSEIVPLAPLNYTTLSYNIAVLKLSAPVPPQAGAIPAQLPAALPPAPSDPSNSRQRLSPLRILGWGPTVNRTQGISEVLNYAPVDVIPGDTCAAALGTCGFRFSGAEKLCTSSDARGASGYGDAGGPVVDEEGVVVALITGNPGCAQPNGIGIKLRLDEPRIAQFVEDNLS